MKRITKNPWFGPKPSGWGLYPITWQGWVITMTYGLLLFASILGVDFSFRSSLRHHFDRTLYMILGITIVLSALYGVVTLLTGTKPGGPGGNTQA